MLESLNYLLFVVGIDKNSTFLSDNDIGKIHGFHCALKQCYFLLLCTIICVTFQGIYCEILQLVPILNEIIFLPHLIFSKVEDFDL